MLDALLECGRHLPVLAMVLSWTSPADWLRLRCTRRPFLEALSEERLKELAAGFPLPGTSLFDAVEAALKQRPSQSIIAREVIGEDEDADDWDSEGENIAEPSSTAATSCHSVPPQSAEDHYACEVALAASLKGFDANEAQQLTGVTPLMRAAEESHFGLCQLLLTRRANADAVTVGGATALSLALDPCCVRCMTMAHGRRWCQCPRFEVARMLLSHTSRGLPAAFAATVRLALQDSAWLPALAYFVDEKGMSINMELLGPDGRRGTALSVALERRVRPVEAPPQHRSAVVASLLELRAETGGQSCYAAWWGGVASNLLEFAALNRCDVETIQLISAAAASD
jgi:hypothetical protein